MIPKLSDAFHSQKRKFNNFDLQRDLLSRWIKPAVIILVIFAVLYQIGKYIPEGFDWKMYFSQGRIHPIWTPWTKVIIGFINWPFVFAITLLSVGLRCFRYRRSPIPMFFAIVSLPTLWVLFMGNLDGLVLLGLLVLPWGAPLVLMKPQLAAFALLASKKNFIAGAIWFVLSLFIWGFWPLNFFLVFDQSWKVEWTQDIALFPWGLVIALPLMWFSRKDEDLLMAAGSFATPHLFPYHFILLMPSLARMKWPWLISTWIITWTPLLANWLGPNGWRFGNLMSIFFWLGIYFSRKVPAKVPGELQSQHSSLQTES
jgi:hypothetical protein